MESWSGFGDDRLYDAEDNIPTSSPSDANGQPTSYPSEHSRDTVEKLVEALQNFMGLFDTPIGRRLHGKDTFFMDAIQAGRVALEKYERNS